MLIVEGLGLLSEEIDAFFDLSIFIDADEADLETWFVARFLDLVQAGSGDEASFFSRFAGLDEDAAAGVAKAVWDGVNGPNLREHIAPERPRARLVLDKGPDHVLRRVKVRS